MFQWLFKRKPHKKVYHCSEDISPAMLTCMQRCIESGHTVSGHEVNGRFVEYAPVDIKEGMPNGYEKQKMCI